MPDRTDTPERTGPFPEARNGSGELVYHQGVPLLLVGGTPRETGAAVGALAVREAPRMTGYPDDLLRKHGVGRLRPLLLWLGEGMVRRFPPAYRAEFEAVTAAAGVERARMVLGNTLFDVKKFVACSALLVEASRSGTGGPLLGRNLDYPSLGYAQDYSLVSVYRPAGRRAFVSVGFPGLVGVLSGMNDAGLTLAVLEVFQAPLFTCRLDRTGLPYALCIRRILEECRTIEEARELLSRLRRTTIFNLAVADRERTAVFEVTTRRVRERPAQEGACVCTNHFRSEEWQPFLPVNFFQTFDRFRILRQAERARERLDLPALHNALHAASMPGETLQTMVFEPAGLRLHVALGACPASAGPLRTLDLEDLLRG